jgi:hypothetical protein
MKKKYLAALMVWASVPAFALAAPVADAGYFTNLIGQIKNIAGLLVPVLISFAVILFFWNVVKFVAGGADDEARKEAKGMMIWSLVAIFVMVSIWGLIAWIQTLTGVSGGTVTTPGLPS